MSLTARAMAELGKSTMTSTFSTSNQDVVRFTPTSVLFCMSPDMISTFIPFVMKVSIVFARVEVGGVQRRYNVRREILIRAGIPGPLVRCWRKTALHLTLPAREASLKFAPRQKASNAGLCPSRWKPTEPHISFVGAHSVFVRESLRVMPIRRRDA